MSANTKTALIKSASSKTFAKETVTIHLEKLKSDLRTTETESRQIPSREKVQVTIANRTTINLGHLHKVEKVLRFRPNTPGSNKVAKLTKLAKVPHDLSIDSRRDGQHDGDNLEGLASLVRNFHGHGLHPCKWAPSLLHPKWALSLLHPTWAPVYFKYSKKAENPQN